MFPSSEVTKIMHFIWVITVFPHLLNIVRGQVSYSIVDIFNMRGPIVLYHTPKSGHVSKILLMIAPYGIHLRSPTSFSPGSISFTLSRILMPISFIFFEEIFTLWACISLTQSEEGIFQNSGCITSDFRFLFRLTKHSS